VQLISRIRVEFKVDILLAEVLKAPTLRAQAEAVDARLSQTLSTPLMSAE
jgi:hypothetical protein